MRTSLPLIATVYALVTATLGCTPAPEETRIDEGPLSGTFNGKRWRVVSGTSERFTPDSNKILSTLSEVEQTTCEPKGFEKLVLAIPFKPGVYALDLALTVHFVSTNGNDDLAATEGELIVHEVSEETIKGGLYAIYNGNPNYEVSGQFTVDRCPF